MHRICAKVPGTSFTQCRLRFDMTRSQLSLASG